MADLLQKFGFHDVAGEGDEHLVLADGAANASESFLQIAAIRFTGCGGGSSSAGGGSSPGAACAGGSAGGGCGSIEYRTVKGNFFEAPTPQTWKNVLNLKPPE